MMDHIAEIKRRVAAVESAGTGVQDAAGAAERAKAVLWEARLEIARLHKRIGIDDPDNAVVAKIKAMIEELKGNGHD